MRLINSYVEWIKKVNAKKEEEEKKLDHFHFQFNKFLFILSSFLATHSKVFPCRKLKFFMKLQLKRAAASGCSWNIFQITPIWLFFVLKKRFLFHVLPFLQLNGYKRENFFSVKHHNEPHYMKVIIFRDEIWFHDILTIKHKKITLWTCSFSLGRTV